jgi:hypothetical protein
MVFRAALTNQPQVRTRSPYPSRLTTPTHQHRHNQNSFVGLFVGLLGP